jgi:hypothetical protein
MYLIVAQIRITPHIARQASRIAQRRILSPLVDEYILSPRSSRPIHRLPLRHQRASLVHRNHVISLLILLLHRFTVLLTPGADVVMHDHLSATATQLPFPVIHVLLL